MHSFIHRFCDFTERNPRDLDLTFKITEPVAISWHGVGGRTMAKIIRQDLHVVQSVRPDIVIVQLGTNDIWFRPPLQVGSDLEVFVHLLHDSYGIQAMLPNYSSSFCGVIKTLTL